MTFTASCNFYMKFMAEMRRTGLFYPERYLLDRMTCGAFIESKGFLAVMTGSTRFTFFHGVHADTRVCTCIEKSVVACAAITVFMEMNRMLEEHRPRFLYLKGNILYLVAESAFLSLIHI